MADKPKVLSLPLLITRSLVIFPGNQQLIEAGREFSINAINLSRNKTDSLIFISSQIKAENENPTADDIYHVGTLCHIISCSERENRLRVRVEVLERITLSNIALDVNEQTYVADGAILDLPPVSQVDTQGYIKSINRALEAAPTLLSTMPKNVSNTVAKSEDAAVICYALAGFIIKSVG